MGIRGRFVIGIVAVLGMSCLAPTEIVVELHTDVPCSVVAANEVGIAVAKPGDDDASFSAVGKACDPDGGLGSIVVLPRNIDEAVGIRVVLGVNKPTSACTAPMYDGCIVARRSLEFIPHTPLELPIELRQSCLGTPCDPHSTCASANQCVDAGTTCTGGTCNVPDAGTTGRCTEFGPIALASNVPVASPHIARMPKGGWAIAYESPAGTIHAMMVDDAGKPIAPDTVMTQLPPNGLAGPIGSDGVGYAITYFDGTQVRFDWRTTAGGLVRPAIAYNGVTLPIGGIVWDVAAQHFIHTVTPGSSSLAVLEVDATNNTAIGLITKNNGMNASLSLGDQIVYVSGADTGGCYVYPCNYTGTSATCGAPFTMNGCTLIRTAANGAHWFGAALGSTQEIMSVADGVVGGSFPTLVDAPLALVAMPAGATNFRVVWRSSGTLYTVLFPNAAIATAVTQNTTGYAGPGAGFDAVADDATSLGYAAVYYQFDTMASAIELVHHCQ